MPDTLHTKIMLLLNQEHRAIVGGHYDELSGLGQTKNQLFEMLTAVSLNEEKMQQIRNGLERNQILLNAALTGVSDAKTRLSALQEVRDGLRVYNQDGQIADVPMARHALEKKS